MAFNVAVLVCALFGVLASILLAYGIYMDKRALLIPWILTVLTTTLIDLGHAIYLFALETIRFNPVTALLFTMDFFLLSLNMYCLVCVVSQYQEYKAGRGTAEHDNHISHSRSLALPPVKFKRKRKAEINGSVANIQRDKAFTEKTSVVAIDACSKLHVSTGIDPTPTITAHPPSRPLVNHCKQPQRKHVQFSSDILLCPKWNQQSRLDKDYNVESSSWNQNDVKPNCHKLDEEPLIIDNK